MPVRLAVAALIADDLGLDDAGAAALDRRERQQPVTGMRPHNWQRSRFRSLRGRGAILEVVRQRLTYERAQLLLCHSRTSTWSMMPARRAMMAAPESRATTASIPVPTKGASDCSSGTA